MSRHCNVLSRQRIADLNAPRPSRLRPPASALTLVEMLVAMAITLIMMAAVVNLFANVGASVRNRRATIEMSGQLRMVRLRLHNDLVGATCPTLTWQRPGDDNGYLEIVEGQWSDKNPSGLTTVDKTTSLVPSSQLVADPDVTDGRGLGDYDDILALTVRSEGEPFVGRGRVFNQSTNLWENGTIESTLAEVIWYAVENPADGSLGEPGMRTVYRRVLLIAPWVTLPTLNSLPGTTINEKILAYYRNYDISAQIYSVDAATGNLIPNTTSSLVPNTLGDLTKRENRFAHRANAGLTTLGWPYIIDQRAIHQTSYDPTNPPPSTMGPLRPFGSPFEPTDAIPERQGEDVMLSDALAFDVRVYDPGAPLRREPPPPSSGPDVPYTALEPNDVGWVPPTAQLDVIGYGAYVDIGWSHLYTSFPNSSQALFADQRQVGWHPNQPSIVTGYPAVYDTWSFHYENDGIAQDSVWGIDQGTNGLDDDNQNGVDDMGERETALPYDVPLRGMQVKLRVYEPDTRNIRETTVTRNFVP